MSLGTSAVPEVAVPFRVANFEVVAELGRGGMGIVYKARDLSLRREVAMKRPRPDLLDRPGFRERFLAEARAASTLLHPHIATVFEALEHDSIPWLVMELVDGISLRQLLQWGNPLRLDDILTHTEGIADVLRAAHARHLLHRDVNPNNVLIGTDGRARLTDFGLACAWVEEPAEPSAITASGESTLVGKVVGTRGYLSPEQALGRPLDPRSDLFSLGLVVYEMATGHRAFMPTDSGEWLDALLHRDPAPISGFNREAPPELARIVRRATAKEPVQRYQSAAEMLLDIRALRHKLDSDAGDPVTAVGRARPVRPWLVAVGGVTAAAAVAVGLWRAIDAGRDRAPFAGWTPRQLTSAPGWEAEPAISPDGSLIAYVSDQAGNPDIWLADVRGGEPLRLTDDPAADGNPAWFPDGSAVAFDRTTGAQAAVWRVPRLGGTPHLLVADAAHPSVAPDGLRLAFTRRGDSGYERIAVAPLANPGLASFLTHDEDGLWDHEEPAWSPDGATICYRDWRDLWLVPADGGRARRLTADDPTDLEPGWSPEGSWIYFSSMRRGTTALWRIRPSGPGLQRVTLGAGPERHPALASRPPRVTYSTHVNDSDIVILDRRTGSQSRIAESRTDTTPDLTPDGRAVLFSSDRRGKYDLWLQRLEQGRPQGRPVQLTDHAGSAACGRFSPDGRWIAYFRVEAGERELWIVPAAGGPPVRLTDRPGADVQPSFSPDGSQLVFVSDRGGGMNLWAAALLDGPALGEARQLTRGPGPDGSPTWSPDGRRLLFLSRGDLWLLTPEIGAAVQVTHDVAVELAVWEPEGDAALVLGSWDGQPAEVRRVGLDPRVSSGVGDVVVPAALGRLGYLSASRDGRFVAVVVEATGGDVWVLEPES